MLTPLFLLGSICILTTTFDLQEVVPLYFRQSRLSSFKRQLNLYGFELISNGPSRGAYFHELFQKDQPNLCRRMRRVAVKVASSKNNNNSSSSKPGHEEEQETKPSSSTGGTEVSSEDAKTTEKETPSEGITTSED